MGGNLLKPMGAVRLNNDDYQIVKADVSAILDRLGVTYAFAPYIGEKESHGDLDIIVQNGKRWWVENELKKPDDVMYVNGDVTSFPYRMQNGQVFQVDAIFMSPRHFDFSVKYFSYNDLGNLYGRYAHKMGLKFGHDGLKMPLRDGTNLFSTLTLTTDFKEAVEFLGFSYEPFEKGFKTFEELYQYVSNHPRFSPRMFDLAERNHTARVRDKKRPTYTGFTSWVEKNRMYLEDFNWPTDKTVWLDTIFKAFPVAGEEHAALWKNHEHLKLAKAKIAGEHIMELTGATGKVLGMIIQEFKGRHDQWADYVLATEQGVLDAEFVEISKSLM